MEVICGVAVGRAGPAGRARLGYRDTRRHFARNAGLRRRLPPLREARVVPRSSARGEPRLFLSPRSAVRDGRCRARHRRARAGNARGQRDGPAVHRRLRGNPAVRDALRVRLRLAARRHPPRRRPGTHRLPDHQRGKMPAAGEQARAGRGPTATRISRRTWPGFPRGGRSWRSAGSRTTRRSQRSA